MMKRLLQLLLTFTLLTASVSSVFAGPGDCDGPEDVNACVNGQTCTYQQQQNGQYIYVVGAPACGSGVGSAVIGPVTPPFNITILSALTGGGTNAIGIVFFMSRIVLFVTIIAGIIVMFNFIRAGWIYLLGGADTKAAGEIKDLLTYSIIGLVIIAVTYTIAGLIGFIFFGDAGFILQPELYSALDIW